MKIARERIDLNIKINTTHIRKLFINIEYLCG